MHKGYKCFHISTSHLYISRDVLFEESIFPFLESSISSSATSPTNTSADLQNPLVQLISIEPCVPAPSQARELSPSSTEPILQTEPVLPTKPVLHIHEPPQISSPPQPVSASLPSSSANPIPSLPMITRSQNNITKPRNLTDSTILYPIP
jgi:hypothetical protein